MHRAVAELGLRGATITSQVKGLALDSPQLYDFYEAMCALDVPVFVHPALVPASDYPQDFTGVNTDTGKGLTELRNYVEAIRRLALDETSKEKILGGTAAGLLGL